MSIKSCSRQQIQAVLIASIAVLSLLFTGLMLWGNHELTKIIQSKQREFSVSAEGIWARNGDALKSVARDYSLWTEMFNFVTELDSEWAVENIDESVVTFGISHSWVVDKQGNTVYEFHQDKAISQPVDFTLLDAMHAYNGLMGFSFYAVDSQLIPLQLFAMPIVHTDDEARQGESAGWLIVGRDINSQVLDELALLMASKTRLISLSPLYSSDTAKDARGIFSLDSQEAWQLKVDIPLTAIGENRVLSILQIRKGMDDLQAIHQLSWLAYGVTLMALALLLLINYLLLGRIIIRPLQAMSNAIDYESINALKAYAEKDNEIGRLSQLMIDYFKQRQSLSLEVKRKECELTDVKQINQNLMTISRTDQLTQVHNRRAFDEYLGSCWHSAYMQHEALALIMVDIDFFKPYNDNYGHQRGDHCLREVAQLLAKKLHRQADVLARYGGEEFAIILPHTDSQGASALAARLLSGIEKANIPHAYSSICDRVTVSMGIASMRPHAASSSDMLVALADGALYEAKARGRNCIISDDDLLNLDKLDSAKLVVNTIHRSASESRK